MVYRDELCDKTEETLGCVQQEEDDFFEQLHGLRTKVVKGDTCKSEFKNGAHSAHHLEVLFKDFFS
jgi:hypothetical protein